MSKDTQFFEETPKIMWQVFEWAYVNDIAIELSCRRDYGNIKYPIIHFSKNGNHIERAFYSLAQFGKEMEVRWREVSLALCVIPFEYKPTSAEE